jgi:hypothetical protein
MILAGMFHLMKDNPNFLIRDIWLAGLCLSVLIVAGCSDSGDSSTSTQPVIPTTTPPVIPSSVQAGVYESTVVEGADDLEFVVSLSAPGSETISVDYATEDGTAIAGTDYSSVSGSVQFAPGEVRKFITISVLDNASAATASSKNMQLVLSNPQNTEFSKDAATGTIIDNNRDAISSETEFNANWTPEGVFTSAATCGAQCHKSDGSIMDFSGEDVSPGTQWQHSVMANAFNDPYWQAAVEDEVESFPQLSGFIEDTCTTCHAPMGRTHAHHTDTDLDLDNYFRFDTAKSQDHSREGVSCTVCHQIDAGNLGNANSFSGGYSIVGNPSDPDYKNIYGPYDSPAGSNMNTQTGHTPTVGKYITGSALCATCHTLYTPALDPETGTPSGTSFLEQGVYLEWQNSVYATGQPQDTQCQGCHMPEPATGYSTRISLMPGSVQPRTPYGQHTLVGGNSHLLEILRDYRTELGIEGSTTTDGFDDQISLTRDFLAGAATIAVSTPATVGNNLEFNVEVTNNAGHKMPSAYPSRRAWLHVTVRDSVGKIIFESGKPDSRGYISTDEARLKADCMSAHKLDGFDTGLCYEPHRDVINDEAQVAIYETVLGDVNGNITHTLLQGAQYLKDNRIPPDGFTNGKAANIEPQTVPSGVSGDDDFNCVSTSEGCGKDSVHYQVNVESQTGPYSVEARLLYQATQPGFVDGMHNVGDRINRFKLMYDAVPPSVEVLATATK